MASTSESLLIQASVLYGAKDLRIDSRPLPAPTADEVQVAVRSTGICGSDLHYYTHFRNGDILVREPLTLGHESTGIVVSVGTDVSGLAPGTPSPSSSAKSFPHAQGTLQERINHPARWCHRLPDAVSPHLGALVEPLSVAIHSSNRAALAPGSSVLVLGAGAVGLLVAAMCKIRGARDVVISDVDEGRSSFAVRHRFAHHSVVAPTKRGADVTEDLALAREGALRYGEVLSQDGTPIGEFDAVFECTGVQSCLQTAIYATRPGGKVMILGMGSPVQTLPISAAALREVDLCGVFRYANAYPSAIEVLSATAEDYPDFPSLISHTFYGLDSVEDAFAMACRKSDDAAKLVLKVVVDLQNTSSV
ncbi:unnamed protein product [Parascedosporium putredinis]|uniref:Enoyl reductase (ER) domain-containing protein n=1 Tax=Parascedosporium putredinis TaxID=1442378 RepID=A0A9P1M8C7_9PEZI|nr:unnamed protein product [Parascedosporium putredinis]CAI7992381.1 unnamed protein product [Parascedosporium putredinis]